MKFYTTIRLSDSKVIFQFHFNIRCVEWQWPSAH